MIQAIESKAVVVVQLLRALVLRIFRMSKRLGPAALSLGGAVLFLGREDLHAIAVSGIVVWIYHSVTTLVGAAWARSRRG